MTRATVEVKVGPDSYMPGKAYGRESGDGRRFYIYPAPVWAPWGEMFRLERAWHLKHAASGLTFAQLPSKAAAERVWQAVRGLDWAFSSPDGAPAGTLHACEKAWVDACGKKARPPHWRAPREGEQ